MDCQAVQTKFVIVVIKPKRPFLCDSKVDQIVCNQ